jgi:hypothetical protein
LNQIIMLHPAPAEHMPDFNSHFRECGQWLNCNNDYHSNISLYPVHQSRFNSILKVRTTVQTYLSCNNPRTTCSNIAHVDPMMMKKHDGNSSTVTCITVDNLGSPDSAVTT